MEKQIFLITGIMASGKSTVADLLASKIDRCVHLRGDVFRKMIISGRSEMSEAPSDEAIKQLYLRYRLTAESAKIYYNSGFSVVIQDNYYGKELDHILSQFENYPINTVILCPSREAVRGREAGRLKKGYVGFNVDSLYDSFMRETPRVGFWLDTSQLSPRQSVNEILKHFKIDS